MTAEDVLRQARAFVGYVEKATNQDLDSLDGNPGHKNYNRFARDLDAVKGFYNYPKQGFAWCDVFVDACVFYASGRDKVKTLYALCQQEGSAGAGCAYSAEYYHAAGRWSSTPEAGAQVFFSWTPGEISHTGLVEDVQGDTIITIEGNTSDRVDRRRYKIGDSRIVGYGLPRYDPPELPEETGTGRYIVRPGDTIWGIALAHGITMAALAELNHMSINGLIRPGDILLVPESDTGTVQPAEESAALAWAKAKGIYDGSCPGDAATLGDVVEMLYNMDKRYSGLLEED